LCTIGFRSDDADPAINCSQSSGQRILAKALTHQPGVDEDVGFELLESPERSMVSLCSRPWPLPCRCFRWRVLSSAESSAQAPAKSAQPTRTRTSFPLLKRFDRQRCGTLLIENSDATNRKAPRRRERKTHSYIIKWSFVDDNRSLPNPAFQKWMTARNPGWLQLFGACAPRRRNYKFLCVTKRSRPLSITRGWTPS
jgi:hypothetical protein